MEEYDIYRRKEIKYCASCLHTEDSTKLFTMNNYGWIFTSLFTNLYLTEQLQDSWICSWCVRRLENAKKLMENFQRAQYLVAKIVYSLNSGSSSEEIAIALSSEIKDLKNKSRLHVNSLLENCNSNSIYPGKYNIEIKAEAPDDNFSGNIGNNLDDGFETELEHDISDGTDTRYRKTQSRTVDEAVFPKGKTKIKAKKKHSRTNRQNDAVESETKLKNKIKKTKEQNEELEKNSSCNIVESQNLEEVITPKDSTMDLHYTSPFDILHSGTVKTVRKINIKQRHGRDTKASSKFKPVKKNKKTRSYLPHVPRLTCSECDQLFIKKIALDNHMFRDHKKKYRCEFCEKKFTKEEYLKTHMARQHEPKSGLFKCDICSVIYKHRVKMVAHMIKHEKYGPSLKDIEKIVCHHCGKICDRNHISNHLLTHSETKGYHCTFCNTSFKVAQILENHIKRKHMDPDIGRTFLCPQCPKKFYTTTEVKYHVKAAHLFQRHPCPHCTKSFPIKGNLRAHILRVHEKVPALRDKKCDLCDKAFSTRRHLRHHRYTHTGEKPYKCDLCASAYNQKYCLTLHKRRTHNIDKPKTTVKDYNNPVVSNIPVAEEFSNNVGNWYA